MKTKPKYFILDVDGVITTGQFLYDRSGKAFKIFGPDDFDMLKILKKYINIIFITADKRGFGISKKRILTDTGFNIKLVSNKTRILWLKKNFDIKNVIYMGDGFFDIPIVKKVKFFIAPQNCDNDLKKIANYVTDSKSGERAVSEACKYILKKFFSINKNMILKKHEKS